MITIENKEIESFYIKNKLKFSNKIKLFEANRNNIKSRNKNNLIIHINNLQDYMKQKNSGLDEFMCRMINEKNKKVFFDLNELLNSRSKFLLIARIIQNIKLFKKYKVNYDFIYTCDKKEDIISNEDIISLKRILDVGK